MPEPVHIEGASPLPKPEASKPVIAQSKEPGASGGTSGARRTKDARGTLEQIAKGVPVLEATAPKTETPHTETLPNRETTTALLNEANSILLDLKDLRLLVNSIATQAADTPLGNELRMDALRAIATMETEGLASEPAAKLIELQGKINALNLPPAVPEASALIPIVEAYNAAHPDKPLPTDLVMSIQKGDRAVAPAVAQMLQTNNDLAAMTWKELTGVEGFTKLTPSPDVILDLSGIPKTPENMKKAADMFADMKKMNKPPSMFTDQAIMGLVYGMTGLQFFIQIAMPESAGSGHGGH